MEEQTEHEAGDKAEENSEPGGHQVYICGTSSFMFRPGEKLAALAGVALIDKTGASIN
jgi:hypothetical protein